MRKGPLAAGRVTSLLVTLLALPAVASDGPATTTRDRVAWSLSLAGGYDTFIHTFPLATEDTTETVSEATVVVGLEGHSARLAVHKWRLRPEFSYGTELLRGRLDFAYHYRPDQFTTLFRLDGNALFRSYQGGSDYALTSDTVEGRFTARGYLSPAGAVMGEYRLITAGVRYRDPSTLEVNYHDLGTAASLRSGRDATWNYAVGGRHVRRSYPDSSVIDRNITALEGNLDTISLEGHGLRLYHRSERRKVRDETVRPSAWAHWTTLELLIPVGGFSLASVLMSEVWQYDEKTAVYFDSWRLRGLILLKRGGLLAPAWLAGVVIEQLAAGDMPETYNQAGLRVGLEYYGTSLIISTTIEYGLRNYNLDTFEVDQENNSLQSDELPIFTYSDFHYWELWLMFTWSLSHHLSLDIMANYQPEKHVAELDDASLAYGSVRLVWRP